MVATRVDTGPMLSASARVQGAGESCAADAAGVQAALGTISRGAGDSGVAAAGAAAAARWADALGKCSVGLTGLAAALRSAAEGYESCEAANDDLFHAAS